MAAVGYFLFAATLFMLDYSRKSLSTKIQVERANRLTVNTSSGCGMGTPNTGHTPGGVEYYWKEKTAVIIIIC